MIVVMLMLRSCSKLSPARRELRMLARADAILALQVINRSEDSRIAHGLILRHHPCNKIVVCAVPKNTLEQTRV